MCRVHWRDAKLLIGKTVLYQLFPQRLGLIRPRLRDSDGSGETHNVYLQFNTRSGLMKVAPRGIDELRDWRGIIFHHG